MLVQKNKDTRNKTGVNCVPYLTLTLKAPALDGISRGVCTNSTISGADKVAVSVFLDVQVLELVVVVVVVVGVVVVVAVFVGGVVGVDDDVDVDDDDDDVDDDDVDDDDEEVDDDDVDDDDNVVVVIGVVIYEVEVEGMTTTLYKKSVGFSSGGDGPVGHV